MLQDRYADGKRITVEIYMIEGGLRLLITGYVLDSRSDAKCVNVGHMLRRSVPVTHSVGRRREGKVAGG